MNKGQVAYLGSEDATILALRNQLYGICIFEFLI